MFNTHYLSMIEKEKFSQLRFKIHKRKEGQKIEEQFPGLFKWKELEPYKRPSRIKDLMYLIFLYDPDSDLIEEFPELHDRKDAAAVEAGLERKESGEWPVAVEKLMNLDDEKFIPAVLRYLKICNNTVWREIVATEQELDRMYILRMQDIPNTGTKDASEIYKHRDQLEAMCNKRVANLKGLYKEFFSDNEDLKEETKDDMLPITPETVFKIFKPLRNVS